MIYVVLYKFVIAKIRSNFFYYLDTPVPSAGATPVKSASLVFFEEFNRAGRVGGFARTRPPRLARMAGAVNTDEKIIS